MRIRPSLSKLAIGAVLAVVPSSLVAFTGGPPAMRAGVPSDAAGLTCTACHRTSELNSDPRGKLTIFARSYKPGVKQTIRVMLEHPEAVKWGFQLAVRMASDDTRQAGSFTATDAIRVVPSGDLQFASHNATSVFTGQRNSAMWEIEWTPPMSGDVMFYAAGNAANNSSSNAGDLIYTTTARVAAETCNLSGTPRITAIRNGASFDERSSIGMNGIVTIGGTGFQAAGQNRTAGLEHIENNRFPSELSCMAVEVGTMRAPILFANPTQINAQIPSLQSFGSTPVRVILNPGGSNEIRSDALNVNITEYAPAFFRLLPTPCIAAVNVADGSISGDPDLLPNVRPSRVGEIVAMFATGLGALEPFYQAGEIVGGAPRVRDQVRVMWNGTTMAAADVLYIGAASGAISGLYQLNIRIPANARQGNNTVQITAPDGRVSIDNTVLFIR